MKHYFLVKIFGLSKFNVLNPFRPSSEQWSPVLSRSFLWGVPGLSLGGRIHRGHQEVACLFGDQLSNDGYTSDTIWAHQGLNLGLSLTGWVCYHYTTGLLYHHSGGMVLVFLWLETMDFKSKPSWHVQRYSVTGTHHHCTTVMLVTELPTHVIFIDLTWPLQMWTARKCPGRRIRREYMDCLYTGHLKWELPLLSGAGLANSGVDLSSFAYW
jgi:hypothetical protein